MKEQSDHRFSNRLARESSPYLLQHAHNPVDWHPWGPEAFELARKENKPIFLSVGYSTCYWCHVMERQSFEVEAVAAEMNQRFINIKVDREERPDVDQLYMTAVQVLTRHGGWPMSVFLTPDLRPFYGGTYFPPADAFGRPGFVSILRGIEDAYRNRPGDVEKTADQLVQMLRQFAEPAASDSPIEIDEAFVEGLVRRSVADYDPKNGGFGGAPKFPRETLLELLLIYLQSRSPATAFKTQVAQMLRHTLDALADGGIRDQLGGGFHRYSTDAHWLVPHFEIMLYDNATLAWCYVEAFARMNEPRYAEVARGIFDFVLREMTSPDGAFYTAFDAEVDSQEGLNYLWTRDEVVEVLEAAIGTGTPQRMDIHWFCDVYGLNAGPNFADPHHGTGTPDKNILFLHKPIIDPAPISGQTSSLLDPNLAAMRRILLSARQKRKQPLLDTKIITSWDALMIRALAHGGKILNEPRYLVAAEKAADFLLKNHRTPSGGLFRGSRDGMAKYNGFLDDYSFLVQALLALSDATGHAHWKDSATEVAAAMTEKFADPDRGGFYFTEKEATDLIIRQKTASDSPLPSGSAVAAMALLSLDNARAARATIALFAPQLDSHGEGMGAMVQAALLYVRKHGKFAVAEGAAGDAADQPLSPEQLAQRVVSVATEWRTPVELLVRLTILRGYHINANLTPADMPLIATTLSVAEDSAATVEYPPGEELRLGFIDEPLRVYGADVILPVRLTQALPPGSEINLHLRYQACDDAACLPPMTKQIPVPVF